MRWRPANEDPAEIDPDLSIDEAKLNDCEEVRILQLEEALSSPLFDSEGSGSTKANKPKPDVAALERELQDRLQAIVALRDTVMTQRETILSLKDKQRTQRKQLLQLRGQLSLASSGKVTSEETSLYEMLEKKELERRRRPRVVTFGPPLGRTDDIILSNLTVEDTESLCSMDFNEETFRKSLHSIQERADIVDAVIASKRLEETRNELEASKHQLQEARSEIESLRENLEQKDETIGNITLERDLLHAENEKSKDDLRNCVKYIARLAAKPVSLGPNRTERIADGTRKQLENLRSQVEKLRAEVKDRDHTLAKVRAARDMFQSETQKAKDSLKQCMKYLSLQANRQAAQPAAPMAGELASPSRRKTDQSNPSPKNRFLSKLSRIPSLPSSLRLRRSGNDLFGGLRSGDISRNNRRPAHCEGEGCRNCAACIGLRRFADQDEESNLLLQKNASFQSSAENDADDVPLREVVLPAGQYINHTDENATPTTVARDECIGGRETSWVPRGERQEMLRQRRDLIEL